MARYNKHSLNAYIRIDSTDRLVPSSLIFDRSQPRSGKWLNLSLYPPYYSGSNTGDKGLILEFDNILNTPVLATDVNAWNTFFDLSTNGIPFSSVIVSGNKITLIGGISITVKDFLFSSNFHILSIIDTVGCIISAKTSFNGMVNLTSISLPGLKSITEMQCFQGCTKLVNVDLPNLQTMTGGYTFSNCSNLVSISLPELINTSGSDFENCLNLTTISFPKLTVLRGGDFSNCPSLTTVNLPEVTRLGGSVFSGCTHLISIDLPKLNYIYDSYSFKNCISLTAISLPSLILIEGSGTFTNCTALTSINLPICSVLGLTLGNDLLFDLIIDKTISLIVPNSLMICNNGNPDEDITALQSNNTVIVSSPVIETPCSGLLYNNWAAKDNKHITAGNAHVPTFAEWETLINSVGGYTKAGNTLREKGNLNWIVRSAGTDDYGFNAIAAITRFATGGFDDLLGKTIWWCSDVFIIFIDLTADPDSTVIVSSVGNPKYGCSIRLIIDTPNYININNTSIGYYIGNDGRVYKCILMPDGKWWLSENLRETEFRDGTIIPNVTGNSAWAALSTSAVCAYNNIWTDNNCDPKGLIITYDAINNTPVVDNYNISQWNTFFNTSSFTSVQVIGNSVSLLGGTAINILNLFEGDTHIISMVDNPGSIVSIQFNGFKNSTLLSGYFPAVTSLGNNAFYGCASLKVLEAPSLAIIGTYCFYGCTSLKGASFLTLTGIPESTFEGCTNLISYNIPNSNAYDKKAFYGCTSLTDIYIDSSPYIGESCFEGCTAVASIEVYSSSIGAKAFKNCSAATTVSFINLIYAGNNCFEGMNNIPEWNLYLLLYIGDGAFKNSTAAITIINMPTLINLGSSTGDNGVFLGITTQTITLTIPTALATDGDVIYLQANNTVTLVEV